MGQNASTFCTIAIIIMNGFSALQAETTEVFLSNSMKCTKEELMTFFPEQVVQSVLIKGNISKEEADVISKELSKKDKDLAKVVEDKAAKLNPNPFKDLSQRDLAIKIYRETLYEVFSTVLKAHGIKNEDKIQAMLEEIQASKSKLFIECIQKQHPTPKTTY